MVSIVSFPQVYLAQTIFKVLKVVLIVSYTTPLLGSISFNHICQPLTHALTGYQAFECTHALASVLHKLLVVYLCLVGLFGLLGLYTLSWIWHKYGGERGRASGRTVFICLSS